MRSTIHSALLFACFILISLTNPQNSLGQAVVALDKNGSNCTFQLPNITWKYSGPRDDTRQHELSLRITSLGRVVDRNMAPLVNEHYRSEYRYQSGKRYRVTVRWSVSGEGRDICRTTMP